MLRRTLHRHPYAVIVGVLWLLPVALMVTGYLLLPDDDWGYGCGGVGCGLPSNLGHPMLLFWLWLWFLLPGGLLGLVVVFVRRRLRANASAGA